MSYDTDESRMNAFHITGNIYIGQKVPPGPKKKKSAEQWTEEEKEQLKDERKKNHAFTKKRNKQLLKQTEKATPADDNCYGLMRLNRGIQTHLIYFCGISRLAVNHGWRVSYGEYYIRMKTEDLKAEHSRISSWCKRNLKGSVTAVSFGVGVKGYVYLYFISTDEDPMKVFDRALSFFKYLRSKGYTPIIARPYEKDPLPLIRWKYCNDNISTLPELLRGDLWPESFRVMRASFSLPYCHKTIRTKEATDAIDDMAHTLDFTTIHIGPNGDKDQYLNTYSVYLFGNDEWLESEQVINEKEEDPTWIEENDNDNSDF